MIIIFSIYGHKTHEFAIRIQKWFKVDQFEGYDQPIANLYSKSPD